VVTGNQQRKSIDEKHGGFAEAVTKFYYKVHVPIISKEKLMNFGER